jgi:MoaA/NifB/PqqE/SkfB family radical SAM enzyme
MKWMPDMVKLAKSVGAESITFTNLIIVDPDNMDLSVVNTPIFEKHLNKAMKLADKYGIRNAFFFQNPFPWMLDEDEVIEPDGKHYGCHEAWRALTIERRGDAKPCCYWEGYIGNAFEKPIDELRNSDEYLELRHELMEGRLNVFCANCGNLRVVTRESAEGRINEAEEMLGAAESLTDDQQEWVRELIGQYRELAAQLPA